MNDALSFFKEVAKKENVTITELERIIGASKGVLSRAIKKGTDVQSKWLYALVEIFPQHNPFQEKKIINESDSYGNKYSPDELIEILRAELKEKQKTIDAQMQTINQLLDILDTKNRQIMAEAKAEAEETKSKRRDNNNSNNSHVGGGGA